MEQAQVRQRILVIDDNPPSRSATVSALERGDYEVAFATNGDEGLRALKCVPASCILVKVHMAELDGYSVCARIRQLAQGRDVPIVLLTLQRESDTLERALRAGGDDIINGPLAARELVLRVQSIIRVYAMRAELRVHDALVRHLQQQTERLMTSIVEELETPLISMNQEAQHLLQDQKLTASARDTAQQLLNDIRGLLRLLVSLPETVKH